MYSPTNITFITQEATESTAGQIVTFILYIYIYSVVGERGKNDLDQITDHRKKIHLDQIKDHFQLL